MFDDSYDIGEVYHLNFDMEDLEDLLHYVLYPPYDVRF